jgi:hypothetical protein
LLFGNGFEKTLKLGFRLERTKPFFWWFAGMADNRAGRDCRGNNENRHSHGFTVRRSLSGLDTDEGATVGSHVDVSTRDAP